MLFNEMVRNNLNMTFDNTNGVIAASCTEEVMNAAAAAGCIGLTVGMESGNRDILRSIRKPGTVENFLRAGEVLNKIELSIDKIDQILRCYINSKKNLYQMKYYQSINFDIKPFNYTH